MTISHNKRRNSGLMYEFLVKTIAQGLVEGNQKKSSLALKILKKYYKPGTQLFKELRLVNALVRTTVSSENVAFSILSEAKKASQNYDFEKLNKEKSYLIKHINHTLQDNDFYNHHIDEYKMYATAQSLLNHWRVSDDKKNISEIAEYEDRLVNWLTREKSSDDSTIVMEDLSVGTSTLLVNIMTSKINEKYSNTLTSEQKEIVQEYAFSTVHNNDETLRRKLEEKKEETITSIDRYLKENGADSYISEKLLKAKEEILKENVETITDDIVTKFMTFIKLKNELNQKEA